MFTFPPSMWVGGIFYEHGHRLIASTVGFLTIIMAVWLWVAEPRRWMRWFGVAALAAVIAQGCSAAHRPLLPAAGDIDRACRARRDLLLPDGGDRPVHVAGQAGSPPSVPRVDDGTPCARLATATTVAIYCQILSARRCGTATPGSRSLTSR